MNSTDTMQRPVDERPVAPRRAYGPVVVGLVLMTVGGIWLLHTLDLLDVRPHLVLPAVLAGIGVALVVGSRDGPHGGLVTLGVFVAVAMLAVAVVPEDGVGTGIGERRYRVAEQSELEPRYSIGAGDLRLDLRDLVLTESAVVEVAVGAGELTVELPEGVAVEVDASVRAGEIDLLGERADGLAVARTYRTAGFEEAAATLTLDLDVAAGEIEVK